MKPANRLELHTTGDWFGHLFLSGIPVIGLCASIYLGLLKKNVDPNLRNFFQAILIVQVLTYGVYFLQMLLDPSFQ